MRLHVLNEPSLKFYLTRNIEKYGSGYIRIRKELQYYPDVSLDVVEIGGGLLGTFKQNEGVSPKSQASPQIDTAVAVKNTFLSKITMS
jgi:hypothetical protein